MTFRLRPALLRLRTRHLHGPRIISRDPDALLVVTVVRNGELYVRSFMEHYQRLGVHHFAFLDNGSTDRTVALLSGYPGVTVLGTNAPYSRYENSMKRYLVNRFSRGKWNLCADIDELFDYPGREMVDLRQFLGYLNRYGYTAVVAQMLDMFSDVPLAELRSDIEDRLEEKYPWFDTAAIRKTPYRYSAPPDFPISMHWGGIRKAVFGTDNGLTKAPLVFIDEKIQTFVGWHHARNAKLADISCLIRHYPFVASFYRKVEEAVASGRYGAVTTDEYKAYWAALQRTPGLSLKMQTAQAFRSIDQLAGFIYVSERYQEWVTSSKLR